MITLTREQAEDLAENINDLLHQWSPSSCSADYQCAFCLNRPQTNFGTIIHDSDCKGESFLKLLRDQLGENDED
jgi:hypothetical protein